MKMKSKFFGINAKMALAALAVCGLFTSCYEKEEIDAPKVANPVYVITGNLISVSTGEPVKKATVTIDGAMSDVTFSNGAFSVTKTLSDEEVKDDKVGGKTYTIKVVADGFNDTERVVYLAKVNKGEVSTANADIYLYDGSTQVTEPTEQEEIKDKDTAAKAESAIKDAVTDVFKGLTVPNATAGTPIVETLNDGSTKVTIPVALNSKAGEPVEISYYALEGFTYTILEPTTRALTPAELWVPSAEKYLNRKSGLRSVQKKVTISAPAGYSVEAYKLTYIMINEALTFNNINGIASYQKNLTITPIWYSHDTHDSHDAHGFNPGAGGGSSANN